MGKFIKVKVDGVDRTPKFRRTKQFIKKYKESRKPEVQLARLKAKREILGAKTRLEQERAKLRVLQLKATGVNVPKFVRGTQELSAFTFGGFSGLSTPPKKGKKVKRKPYNPFRQF